MTIQEQYNVLVALCLHFATARKHNYPELEAATANSVMEFLKEHHGEAFWEMWNRE